MLDYHIHTDISGDCKVDMLKMARAASERGLLDICFTEHLDIDFPAWDFSIDTERYDSQIQKARAAYPEMRIAKGIEAGIDRKTFRQISEYISKMQPDFVIGSQHLIYGLDPFDKFIWQNYSHQQVYLQYLNEMTENISTCGFFDVLGHLGYPAKACVQEDKVLRYADYPEQIDALLKILIENGKGIEVNTSGIPPSGSAMPEGAIINRYFEMGGEIITVGSDAHREEAVGRYISETLELLKSIGFKYVCAFKKRVPKFLKL